MAYYVVFDVGGTKTKHGVMDRNGELITSGDYVTNCRQLEPFLEDMENVVKEYQRTWDIKGIAMSLPGFVDSQTGYTEFAGAIIALNGQNVKTLLEEKTSLRVEVENDANCAALAEKFSGHAKECDSFICMTLGTGVGGGIFAGGELVRGASFRGGEFGMMLTETENGQFTTLNSSASTAGLIRSYKEQQGIPQSQQIDGQEIFEKAKHDPAIEKMIDQWYKRIAIGIYNVATVLNPEKILIGGGVSARPDLIPNIEKHLHTLHAWKNIQVTLETCYYFNQAGMMGALYHFLIKEGHHRTIKKSIH
ncbi:MULTISPECIES: ROK family protein [Bacillus]|uniref:ROK family protein n=1 Tax=Bacillus TaxID=1386 RepID=UPI000D7CC8B5|nr:ROK family protein [Bacillus altitudinis]MCL6797868.1 ROK family protein [Bacillus altitudinis]MCY7450817.1 ROK family protein [Bacillus altitudinis]MCY7696406.1 ROK family protein [Bacillus altitudinis]NMF14338.1 ROK family protein [Bacillus altitudinis]PYH26492.1 N-acetylmannosamine kinase [Bacillus altitudinis]